MSPSAIIARIRRIAAAFGFEYRGSITHVLPDGGGYVCEVRLPTETIDVYWEKRK